MRVIVPHVGHHLVGVVGVGPGQVGRELVVAVMPHPLVVPLHAVAVEVVDGIAPGGTVEALGQPPPGAACSRRVVLVETVAVLNVEIVVHVPRDDVYAIRLE